MKILCIFAREVLSLKEGNGKPLVYQRRAERIYRRINSFRHDVTKQL